MVKIGGPKIALSMISHSHFLKAAFMHNLKINDVGDGAGIQRGASL